MALVEDRPPADLMGRVPLHYAALFGDLHRRRGSGRRRVPTSIGRTTDGQTALHYAAQGCSVAVAELLLANGAQVDAEDLDGNTPLWNATLRTRGDGAVVQLLIGRGADPHHANHDGRTPMQSSRRPWRSDDLRVRSVH